MAKYYNNKIKSGKVAGSVFSVRFGEVIERAYNPIVANPNTDAQVASRAKLKLMSQLAAVMAPYIAMRRQGAVSPRNLFIRVNYPAASYADAAAEVDMSAVKLTASVVSLPEVVATRDTSGIAINLDGNASSLDMVVYVAFVRQLDGTIRALTSKVVTDAGTSGNFATQLIGQQMTGADLFIYAYGVRYNTDAARVRYGDMELETAEAVAQLLVSVMTYESDYTLTETKFVELAPQA